MDQTNSCESDRTTNSSKAAFLNYQEELDERHDRHEAIVKCSRDITNESKKIIFLLHRYSNVKSDKEKSDLLEQAERRLEDVRKNLMLKAAKVMSCLADQYMHNAAITFGIQEHIEATAFLKFILTGKLLMYDELEELFTFLETDRDGSVKKYRLNVTPSDYLLGLSDVGGELMRFAINQDHLGQHRDFVQKKTTFRQSLMKVENLLYMQKLMDLEKIDANCPVSVY